MKRIDTLKRADLILSVGTLALALFAMVIVAATGRSRSSLGGLGSVTTTSSAGI